MSYLQVYALLMLLLAGSVWGYELDLPGWLSVTCNLGIAGLKAFLIGYVFMHLRESEGRVLLFALGAFFWLFLLVGITFLDYATRFG